MRSETGASASGRVGRGVRRPSAALCAEGPPTPPPCRKPPRQPSCWPLCRPAPAHRRCTGCCFRRLTASRPCATATLTDALGRVPPNCAPAPRRSASPRCAASARLRPCASSSPQAPPPRVDALLLTAPRYCGTPTTPLRRAHPGRPGRASRQARAPLQGFINAVLRRFLREREALSAAARRDPIGASTTRCGGSSRQRDWFAQWQDISPPTTACRPWCCRVNAAAPAPAPTSTRWPMWASAPAWSARGAAGHRAGPTPPGAGPAGFAAGDVSVQDAAAQLAAHWLAQVFAPGAPRAGRLCCPWRQDRPFAGAARARPAGPRRRRPAPAARAGEPAAPGPARAQLKAADARQTATWWDGRPFDAIPLDAPCSAAGIDAPSPDVRWLRRPDDIRALAQTQTELMDALCPAQAGGRLLYATCSIFRAEGQAQADAFCNANLTPSRCLGSSGGHLLPVADNDRPAFDGFFYAHFLKRPPELPRRPPCLSRPGARPGWRCRPGRWHRADAVPDRTH